ncbi:restriction endonuclease subunit S [Arenibacter sp. 6A1]|uniref:restriction endonuclease subunit S n=1 Tax=Arenibacter sp. 6A1 TaxID=2720391 RepID=UPI00197C3FF5|nr:restriction endonuclease subunit S [Arenibacter sp. 6A1]
MITKQLSEILKGNLFTDGDWIESKDQDPKGEIRLIQLADIGDGYFIDKSSRFINRETAKKLKCTFINKGDILVARMPDPLGRCCIFPFEGDEKFVTAVDVCILRPSEEKNATYLAYMINSPFNRSEIERQSTGTTRKRITRKRLGNLNIPLPPLAIQQRIAGILDAAAALRDKTAQLLTEYDVLAQSIFLEMFGDPVTNPKGWSVFKLKNVTSKIGSGATPRGGKEAYKEEGISLIRSLNIHDNFFKMKNLAFIDDKQADKLKNVTIDENDVLINITGASVARCAIVPAEILPARVNQHVSILRTKREKLNPIFLTHLLISPNCKVKLLGVGTSNGATREAITKEQLENFEIPAPPINLQNQFAEKIALIEQQKALAKQELKESEDLFNCLLQKAFKGELQ